MKEPTGNKNICGLVLAGGKSSRMGDEKGLIPYHGKKHVLYLYEMLRSFLPEVFISCKDEHRELYPELTSEQFIIDPSEKKGPVFAIKHALSSHPGKALLVLACDLPFIQPDAIQALLDQRNLNFPATVFEQGDEHLPEPLIGIWEQQSLPLIKQALEDDITCPRKILMMNKYHGIIPDDKTWLFNANSPNDREKAYNQLKDHQG